MHKVSGTCDICKKRYEAKDSGTLARILGTHKLHGHGIKGHWRDNLLERSWGALQRYYRRVGRPCPYKSMEQYAERNDWKLPEAVADTDNLRRRKRQTQLRQSVTPEIVQHYTGNEAVAIKLDHCPCCGHRFYAVKPQE